LTVKLRRWPETLWELLFPFGCGIIGGVLAFDPRTLEKGYTQLELFEALTDIYFIALLMITVSFVGTALFILQEMISDR
jgi:hypothetical protein